MNEKKTKQGKKARPEKFKLNEKTKKEIFKNAKFLAAWLIAFSLIYYSISFTIGFQGIESLTAGTSAKILESFGAGKVKVNFDREPVLMQVQGRQIEISELCTGLLETLMLAVAILASFGISWKKRIYGAIGAVIFGFAFNQFRIFVSVMQILNTDALTAELTHDVFFRLSILIVIAGYYYFWFRKATEKN